MEIEILSAQETFELTIQSRTTELSLSVIMESIQERASNGFDYWMTFGVITEKEEKLLKDNGYRISRLSNKCIQVCWQPKHA